MNLDYLPHVKPEPFRDASRIVISCEGAWTEPNYFDHFKEKSRKLTVHLIGKDEDPSLSAPKYVLDRTVRYIEKLGLSRTDEVYLVIDVDRWDKEAFRDLHELCQKYPKWHLILSNPCFEVWLYMHKMNTFPPPPITSKHMKHLLSLQIPGGYHPVEYIPDVKIAMKNAVLLDLSPTHYFPGPNSTKMHILAKRLIEILGENDFQQLIQSLKKN
jgi:hypothetical protein